MAERGPVAVEMGQPERGQIFAVEHGEVVVEWYHFGEDEAYEFAVQLRFDAAGQAALAKALELVAPLDAEMLVNELRTRFGNYWRVRDFADARGISYEVRRDLWP